MLLRMFVTNGAHTECEMIKRKKKSTEKVIQRKRAYSDSPLVKAPFVNLMVGVKRSQCSPVWPPGF